ncbi:MAG: protein-tyrosine-phosphatase [Saprospiraceae bacterium]
MFNEPGDKRSFPIKLFGYMRVLEQEDHLIPKTRKLQLKELADFISERKEKGKTPKIMVICTHNSRRSQMAQLWLKVAAASYGIGKLRVFSGGTEATAFHPNAVAALKYAGLPLEQTTEGDNPFYECEIGNGGDVLVMFSKKYDDPRNPKKGFAAVMVCNEADEACPVVVGAKARFSISYDDPKKFDGTPEEAAAYQERCRQIAREMFYVIRNAVE